MSKTPPLNAPRFVLRLPGFVSEEPVGLGQTLARATQRLGVPTCGGCARRAAALDRWIAFSGGRTR
jgi:hypothetical protein